VDPGESAEAALEREIQEEIGLKAQDVRYFVSAPNRYEYRGVVYNTCDLVFTGRIGSPPQTLQAQEVAGYRMVDPGEMPLESLAFPSLRWAMEQFVAHLFDT
jgi:8-oxo-dGTP pyrophosphatase MutT (NUDIX family)